MEEIKNSYKSEWILIENPETDENLEIRSGIILWHSKDRDELYRKARELKPRHSVVVFTGSIQKESVIVL
jgi:hypothetical protein